MHILLSFLITIGLVSGFYSVKIIPEGEVAVQYDIKNQMALRGVIVPDDKIKFEGIVRQQHDYSCGSAALATLLVHHFGEKMSEQEVIKGLVNYGNRELIRQKRAFSFLDMQQLMTALGYKSDGYRATIEDISNPEIWPCIAAIRVFEFRHFVVVRGVYKNRIFVADPWFGNMSYSEEEFEAGWYQKALFIIDSGRGKKPVEAGLRLKKEDLRIIDEEDSRNIIKSLDPSFLAPDSRRLEDQAETREQYRRH